MTQEEKAKRYDKISKEVKDFFEGKQKMYSDVNQTLEYLFPELAESENDRIRTGLINGFKECLKNSQYPKNAQKYWHNIKIEDILAWLEKQGKQKPVDKIEPKFKVGDWIIFDENHNSIYQVERMDNYRYYLRHYLGGTLSLHFDNELIRQWTIQDAKDGDVLVHSSFMFDDFIFIYNNTSILQSYCYYSNKINRFIIEDRGHHCPWNMQEVTPATKEQRDLLFSKIKETGYEWDTEKKKLRKIEKQSEQKPAWSEEDKHRLEDTIYFLDTAKKHYASTVELDACINWLKSLKERYIWKPSKEQIIALRFVLNNISYNNHKEEISGLLEQIKKL